MPKGLISVVGWLAAYRLTYKHNPKALKITTVHIILMERDITNVELPSFVELSSGTGEGTALMSSSVPTEGGAGHVVFMVELLRLVAESREAGGGREGGGGGRRRRWGVMMEVVEAVREVGVVLEAVMVVEEVVEAEADKGVRVAVEAEGAQWEEVVMEEEEEGKALVGKEEEERMEVVAVVLRCAIEAKPPQSSHFAGPNSTSTNPPQRRANSEHKPTSGSTAPTMPSLDEKPPGLLVIDDKHRGREIFWWAKRGCARPTVQRRATPHAAAAGLAADIEVGDDLVAGAAQWLNRQRATGREGPSAPMGGTRREEDGAREQVSTQQPGGVSEALKDPRRGSAQLVNDWVRLALGHVVCRTMEGGHFSGHRTHEGEGGYVSFVRCAHTLRSLSSFGAARSHPLQPLAPGPPANSGAGQ
ncbi:hypothetical protein CYMTET_21407 [Cymbomonas tetramitiformis]|uniref:Uncharacterized protein n=1 Tax=Cymbomonas tetramitiformis TaxID=36881 RepID=A0AAE0L376_9CHLO|nr:hypothetical protein CYMTET_21407 [Cymbomonas tetramitiformis]